MDKLSTRDDREWRCMAIAIYLDRYIEHVSQRMRGSEERITLASLADCLEADLENGCREEFVAWKFAIGRSPEVLRNIADSLGANGFDKMLAEGEYVAVVLMVASDVFRMGDGESTQRSVC